MNATTPAPMIAPVAAGRLGIGAPRIPAEFDERAWTGLDEGEAECAPEPCRNITGIRPLNGGEYEAVRTTVKFYQPSYTTAGWGSALAYRQSVAKKLGVEQASIVIDAKGWPFIEHTARVVIR